MFCIGFSKLKSPLGLVILIQFLLHIFILPKSDAQIDSFIYHKFDRGNNNTNMLYIGDNVHWLEEKTLSKSSIGFGMLLIDGRTKEALTEFYQVDRSNLVDTPCILIVDRKIFKEQPSSFKDVVRNTSLQNPGRTVVLMTGYHTAEVPTGEKQVKIYTSEYGSPFRLFEFYLSKDWPTSYFYTYEDFANFMDTNYEPPNYIDIERTHSVVGFNFKKDDNVDKHFSNRYRHLLSRYLYRWGKVNKITTVVTDLFDDVSFTGMNMLSDYLRMDLPTPRPTLYVHVDEYTQNVNATEKVFPIWCEQFEEIMIYGNAQEFIQVLNQSKVVVGLISVNINKIPCSVTISINFNDNNEECLSEMDNTSNSTGGIFNGLNVNHLVSLLQKPELSEIEKFLTFSFDTISIDTMLQTRIAFRPVSNLFIGFNSKPIFDCKNWTIPQHVYQRINFFLLPMKFIPVTNYVTDWVGKFVADLEATGRDFDALPEKNNYEGRRFKRLLADVKLVHDRSDYGISCLDMMRMREAMVTMSYVKDYNVAQDPYFRFGNLLSTLSESTFEDTNILRYYSYAEKCVVMGKWEPTSPGFDFDTDFAGVTFNLRNQQMQNLSSETYSALIQLIHLRFPTVELIAPEEALISSLSSVRSTARKTKDKAYKYLVNPGDSGEFQRNISSQLEKLLKTEAVTGIHFQIQSCNEVNKEVFQSNVKLIKEAKKLVGVHKDFENCLENLAPLDYVIYHLHLFNLPRVDEYIDSINQKEYSKLLADITRRVDDVRNEMFNFKSRNPKITIYLRLWWPTKTSSSRSRETQYTKAFLVFWNYVNEFAQAYQIHFLLYEAFDNDVGHKFGWWKVKNYSGIATDTKLVNFKEKQADYFGIETLRPNFNETRTNDGTNTIIFIVFGVFAVFIVISLLIFMYWFKSRFEIISKAERNEFQNGKQKTVEGDEQADLHIFGVKYDKSKYEINKWEFNPETSKFIGKGHFGLVFKTRLDRLQKDVAVKTVKDSDQSTKAVSVRTFLREIKIMSYVGEHENIVVLLGAYTKEIQKGTVFLITEFCENGSLLECLQGTRDGATPVQRYDMCRFCQEIGTGMDYLEGKKVIHGDLSARNVLLDKYMIAKISDFGLARTLDRYNMYQKQSSEPLPWPWMAIECLENLTFTIKSDVWSMGVTFWEIFTLGKQPYAGQTWDFDFPQKLRQGQRLPKPDNTSDEIYEKILNCWNLDAKTRPDAKDLATFFLNLRRQEYTEEFRNDKRSTGGNFYLNYPQ